MARREVVNVENLTQQLPKIINKVVDNITSQTHVIVGGSLAKNFAHNASNAGHGKTKRDNRLRDNLYVKTPRPNQHRTPSKIFTIANAGEQAITLNWFNEIPSFVTPRMNFGYPRTIEARQIWDWVLAVGLNHKIKPNMNITLGGERTFYGKGDNRWFDIAFYSIKLNLQEMLYKKLKI